MHIHILKIFKNNKEIKKKIIKWLIKLWGFITKKIRKLMPKDKQEKIKFKIQKIMLHYDLK